VRHVTSRLKKVKRPERGVDHTPSYRDGEPLHIKIRIIFQRQSTPNTAETNAIIRDTFNGRICHSPKQGHPDALQRYRAKYLKVTDHTTTQQKAKLPVGSTLGSS
jgi:hypothetical protein